MFVGQAVQDGHDGCVRRRPALPGEGGIEFCRRTRKREEYRDIPIVALTAYPNQIWRDRVIEAGCTDYVGKPFEPKTLIETVRKHLAG